ncbi:MAG: 2-amino-4-hydroxy-6-hydroxymethyldihydropteridine diphosphokinase [Rhodobacteraceae bacterium]|nr:2-amino-4-hydroxy-6-hydroxymethyldihydropteridine diphosphokinase [Paracoccaceae bacterium]
MSDGQDAGNSGRIACYLVALGGNVATQGGAPEATLRAAIQEMSKAGLEVVRQSRLFRTSSFPDPTDPEYVNACVEIRAALSPAEVLRRLHHIEAEFGRERVQRWGQRTLDLDLLAQGDTLLPDGATYALWRDLAPEQRLLRAPDDLILPHPRLHERSFVLVPLAEIAPEWRHPALGLTVQEMLDRLPRADRDSVRPIAPD